MEHKYSSDMRLINLWIYRYNMSIIDKRRGVYCLRAEEYIPLRITELCEKRGYTKYRLAQLTDMSQTALANIINKRSVPTVVTLERRCDTFDITLAQFFTENSGRLNLTEEQNEILEIWDGLETKEKEILLSFIRSLKK